MVTIKCDNQRTMKVSKCVLVRVYLFELNNKHRISTSIPKKLWTARYYSWTSFLRTMPWGYVHILQCA